MNPTLFVISDLWGDSILDWGASYKGYLQEHFNVVFHDARALGELSYSHKSSQEELHTQFVNGGINTAVENLLKRDIKTDYILGFSVGGCIAWKYALKESRVKGVCAISANRLRYETEMPNCKLDLVFGANDVYKPSEDWLLKYKDVVTIISSGDHHIYRQTDYVKLKSNDLIIDWL